MDGFDDLLAPSRQALEDNPFADPFAKRSNSPDPWASPFAQSSSDAFDNTHSASESFSNLEPVDSHPNDVVNDSTESAVPQGPLVSATQATDDEEEDNRPLGILRSPGFRESLPTVFNETATIRPTEPEELEPEHPANSVESSRSSSPPQPQRAASPTTPVASSTTPTHSRHSSQPKSGFIAHHSPSASQSEFVPPLGDTAPTGIERSINALSLGGETLGGWQRDESPWGDEHVPSTSTSTSTARADADDDSDDDKPIGRALKLGEDIASNTFQVSKPSRNDHGLQPVFQITVDDPQKVGDPIRSFTMYTVHTRTTSPLFQKSAFSVLRRYSDFLWLYETLSINNPGVVVPPVPEKNPFGRFDDQFVKQRRMALEKCIQKIANHPVLGKDTDLKLFLESDSFSLDIKHRKAEIAHERGGLIASIGQTIAGPRFYETDEWFDRQKAYLDSLESQLRGLVKAIELVAKHRSDLAIATGEFAQVVGDLSSSDIGKQLSQSLAGLADVERKAQDLQHIQSEQDMVTFLATADEYARLINSVRLAFHSRIRLYHAWKNAESDVLRTKQSHEKNRAQGRIPPDRLSYSLSQIAEAERRSLEAKREFDSVSQLVKTEVARFEQERIEDFKDSLHAFLEGMISRQKELISGWENYQQMLLKKIGGGGPGSLRSVSGGSVVSS